MAGKLLPIRVSDEEKQAMETHAKAQGFESLAAYIMGLVAQDMGDKLPPRQKRGAQLGNKNAVKGKE